MRALNKQQHQTLTAGLEPGTERLIMTKVLPAKRAAIEAFTDRRVRPGFTDVNDPYTHCLREIERRIKGTGFANGVDRDDLTCRTIAQVASEHEVILAATDPIEREAMQHELPQKVIESFVRNKLPELRRMKTLPGVIMDPAGRPFALDPEMQVLVDAAGDGEAAGGEAGQTPSVIGSFPNRNPTMIGIETPNGAKRFVEIPEGDTDLNHIESFSPDSRNPTHITIRRPGEDPVTVPMPSNGEVMRMLGLDAEALAEAGGGAIAGPQDRLFLPDRRPETVGEDPVAPPVAAPETGPGSDPDTILGPGFDSGTGLDPNLDPGPNLDSDSDSSLGLDPDNDPDVTIQPTPGSDLVAGPTDTRDPSGPELSESDQENITENQSDLEVLRRLNDTRNEARVTELTFLGATNFPKMRPEELERLAFIFGLGGGILGAAKSTPAVLAKLSSRQIISAAIARAGAAALGGPVGIALGIGTTGLAIAVFLTRRNARLRRKELANLEHAYEMWQAQNDGSLPDGFEIEGPFQTFLDGLSPAGQRDYFNTLIDAGIIDRDARLDPGQELRPGEAFEDMNELVIDYAGSFESIMEEALIQVMFEQPPSAGQLGLFRGVRQEFINFRESIRNNPLLEDRYGTSIDSGIELLAGSIGRLEVRLEAVEENKRRQSSLEMNATP